MRIRWALLVAGMAMTAGASPRESMLVSPAWLAAHLRDPNLVLLHVGDKTDYEREHIPGARHVTLPDISLSNYSPTGLRLEMPPDEDLRQRLQKLGISDGSRIVVYFARDWLSPVTRVLFTLDYAGLGHHASMLDGGMQAWIKSGHETTHVIPQPVEGKLSRLKTRPAIVNADWVRAYAHKRGVAIVDARSKSFYDGTQAGGPPDHPHRAGHIDGALSIPYSEIVNDDLKLRSPDELRALFQKAGVRPGDTVVTYCHIGQQATAVGFAARTLGYKVLLYDGSFEEWSRRPGAAVENPSAKRAP